MSARENTQAKPKFSFVGGHLCLDFVNTEILSHGKPKNLLPEFSYLIAWLIQAGLLEESVGEKALEQWEGTPVATDIWQQAMALRQLLRAVVTQIVAGEGISKEHIEAINEQLRQRSGYWQLQPDAAGYSRQFIRTVAEPAHLLASIAETAVDLLCEADFSLLKQCENPKCIRYFYDSTKNHSRRWCSMEACGNRAKVAAYYQRKKANQ